MKKQLIISLAAAMILGVAGTSFAAANPFTDVPAKHWSYDAVSGLAKAGIVDGYGDGTFKGDKVISRYEMAQIVAKAMAHSDKADDTQKATINKLSVEFASELEGLNVKVNKSQEKLYKLDMSGIARIRYDHVNNDNEAQLNRGVMAENFDLDINYSCNVNEEWAIKGESEWQRDLRHTRAGSSVNDQFKQLYMTGPIGGATVKAGKYSYLPTYGLVFDDQLSGAQVSFGNVLKTTLSMGKTNVGFNAGFNGMFFIPYNSVEDTSYQAIEFAMASSKATNIKASYSKMKAPAIGFANELTATFYEVGFDSKFGKDFVFTGAYAKSDIESLNKAYLAQIQYKAADINVVGSSDVYVAYRKFQPAASIAPTGDWLNSVQTDFGGFKGVRIGYDYVPMKNAKFATWYQTGRTDTDINDSNVKTFRAQLELSF